MTMTATPAAGILEKTREDDLDGLDDEGGGDYVVRCLRLLERKKVSLLFLFGDATEEEVLLLLQWRDPLLLLGLDEGDGAGDEEKH